MFHSHSHRSSEGAHTSSEVKPSPLSRIGGFAKKTMKNIVFQIFSLSIALVGMGVSYAAWTTLTATQGASGQTVTAGLMQGVINNLNDLNTRVNSTSRSAVLESSKGLHTLPSSVPDYIFCDSGGYRLIGMLYVYNQASSYVTYLVGASHQVVYNYATNALTNQYGTCDFPF